MVGFIDNHRGEHGVEPSCKVLPIAQSTYYDHLAKRVDPDRQSERARRDAALQPEIRRVFEENWRVFGVRKVDGSLVGKASMSPFAVFLEPVAFTCSPQ